MKRLLILLPITLLAGLAAAQDTVGVSTSTSGAVIKGKAPVSHTMLKVHFPKPVQFTLSNGVKVYALEDHRMPAIRLSLEVLAGQMYEPKPGVAQATASLLTDGTATMTYEQIGNATEDMGSNVNANAGLETANISMSCLKENFGKTLDLWANCLLHPSFPADQLDQFRHSQRAGFAGRRTNPTGIAGELVNRLFYASTPYGRSTPSAADLAKVTVDDVTKFHDEFYVPNGAVIGVTGDFKPAALKADLENALASWKPAGAMASEKVQPVVGMSASHVYLVDRPSSAQTVVEFASLAVPTSDKDYIDLTVANRILGGGSSGRLFQNIRERKGYTYGAYSSLGSSKWPALWTASASVRTEVTQPAITEFYSEFTRLRDEKVTDDELSRAKRSILGGFALTLESPDAILARTQELRRLGLPSNYWDKYADEINAVTADDVQRVAKKYLSPEEIQLICVGDKAKIQSDLGKFGSVQLIPMDGVSTFVALK